MAVGLSDRKLPHLGAMLAEPARKGWSDALMAEAAEQYARIYARRQVKGFLHPGFPWVA